MKTFLIIFTLATTSLYSQYNLPGGVSGIHRSYDRQRGAVITTNPILYDGNRKSVIETPTSYNPDSANSIVRYIHTEQYAIGEYCGEAGNGNTSIVGWYSNVERASAYGNSNGTALWEYTETTQTSLPSNYVAITPNGSFAVNGFNTQINLLNGTSGGVVWTYTISYPPDTIWAGPVGITSSGSFIIASANEYWASDTSRLYGFNSGSNVPVWSLRIPPVSTGSAITGVRISGNDSLAIVNTYSAYYVIRTYTGQQIATGSISGTQTSQGISGNGNLVATIDYYGWLKLYQWNGSSYAMLWQSQEPPGTYYNWMSAVDISYDGTMVAGGTLDFLTSSTFDGKVKFWSVAGGSTPVWTYSGTGDNMCSVGFSKNGRFLFGASWGNYYNPSVNNLIVFKTTHQTNTPWFAANSPGSFFWGAISDDGQTVIGSGKAVHARSYGYGGNFYNLLIDTAETPLGIHNNHGIVPVTYGLSQNYPNPFNPTTIISYNIPSSGSVKLSVYDVLGRELKVLVNEYQKAGEYNVSFDASNLPSGVYFYRITSGNFTDTKKMTLIK